MQPCLSQKSSQWLALLDVLPLLLAFHVKNSKERLLLTETKQNFEGHALYMHHHVASLHIGGLSDPSYLSSYAQKMPVISIELRWVRVSLQLQPFHVGSTVDQRT